MACGRASSPSACRTCARRQWIKAAIHARGQHYQRGREHAVGLQSRRVATRVQRHQPQQTARTGGQRTVVGRRSARVPQRSNAPWSTSKREEIQTVCGVTRSVAPQCGSQAGGAGARHQPVVPWPRQHASDRPPPVARVRQLDRHVIVARCHVGIVIVANRLRVITCSVRREAHAELGQMRVGAHHAELRQTQSERAVQARKQRQYIKRQVFAATNVARNVAVQRPVES